jgi:hypothetical protein
MEFGLGVAARTLALDLAAGEVVRAFGAAGIANMVLKGPAMAHHLYQDALGCRNYGDIDLLVAPGHFDRAGRLLLSLGFTDGHAGLRASEAARLPTRPWHRDGAASVTVDLHQGFHCVVNRPAWWRLMWQHRQTLVIEGQPVAVPDRAGCAVIAALHAFRPAAQDKPVEDLRRALLFFGEDTWREAAEIARAAGADGAFLAALRRQREGALLADRLGLEITGGVSRAGWFAATSTTRGTDSLSAVLAAGSWSARARRALDVAVPSQVALGGQGRAARAGLIAARAGRLCVIAIRVPPLLLAWHRSYGTAGRPRSGALPKANAAGPPTRRGLPTRVLAAAGTGWWTLRTWWAIRRRLRRYSLLAAAPARAPRTPNAPRAALLVLRCSRATCLEAALVRQIRAAADGAAVDVIVGVTPPASGFRAHAWLDGDRVDPQFTELWRCPPAAGPAGDVTAGHSVMKTACPAQPGLLMPSTAARPTVSNVVL